MKNLSRSRSSCQAKTCLFEDKNEYVYMLKIPKYLPETWIPLKKKPKNEQEKNEAIEKFMRKRLEYLV